MRLIGGSSETEGTVEVCHNKTWGMVSGLGWGEEDARVTCRQLQLPVEGITYNALYCRILFHYALQVSILTLILPLASLDELFTSVLFDVLGVNRESLIALRPTILMNKEGYLLDTWQWLG